MKEQTGQSPKEQLVIKGSIPQGLEGLTHATLSDLLDI